MKNQVDAIRTYNEQESIAHVLNSSLSKSQINIVMNDIRSNETKLLYVAPRVFDQRRICEIFKIHQYFIFSELMRNTISEWGHDFRPEYRRLREIIDNIGRRPIIGKLRCNPQSSA